MDHHARRPLWRLGISLTAGAASAAIRRAVAVWRDERGLLRARDRRRQRAPGRDALPLRGAALKVGQMLSFNDADVLPPAMRVAMDAARWRRWMPQRQLKTTLRRSCSATSGGDYWHSFSCRWRRPLDWTGAPRRLPRRSADRDQGPVPGRGGFDPLRSLVHAAAHLLLGARATHSFSIASLHVACGGHSHPHTPAHGPTRCAVVVRRSSSHGPPSSSRPRSRPPMHTVFPLSWPSTIASSLHGGRFAGPRGGSQGAAHTQCDYENEAKATTFGSRQTLAPFSVSPRARSHPVAHAARVLATGEGAYPSIARPRTRA